MRRYFKKLNIPLGPVPLPVFGNLFDIARKGITNYDLELIQKYGKTVGQFEATVPVVLTTDTKLIKLFLIKEFSHFVNRRVPFLEYSI